ncbi:uncharacterized protein VTP21DRAFT_8821 [Calcarisporiella thermophila]|uniref:uncharacterized protein n=1 Tax=Calcarisporiella thermophila TaxID=911321 RepID=UPI003743B251
MASLECRWGILGAGNIAKKFVNDLILRANPSISHTVQGVAARDLSKAQQFAAQFALATPPACYGSYEELVRDPNVQVVYVATPHTFHHAHVRLCLENGKHVLCEKPITINALQLKDLIELAREKGLFLMEGMWTRCFPGAIEIRKVIEDGTLGEIQHIRADFGEYFPAELLTPQHRLLDPALGGGALLDVGVYPLAWVFMLLYKRNQSTKPKVSSAVVKSEVTGVDETAAILLQFGRTLASVSCSFTCNTGLGVVISGTKGTLVVKEPIYQVGGYSIQTHDGKRSAAEFPFPGFGMHFEADHVAECLARGAVESNAVSLDESLAIMECVDEIRRQNQLIYPGEQ